MRKPIRYTEIISYRARLKHAFNRPDFIIALIALFLIFYISPITTPLINSKGSFTTIKILIIVALVLLNVITFIIGKATIRSLDSLSDEHFFQWHYIPALLLLIFIFTNIPLLTLIGLTASLYCFSFIDPMLCTGFIPGLLGFVTGRLYTFDFMPYPFIAGIIFALIFILIGGILTSILDLEN